MKRLWRSQSLLLKPRDTWPLSYGGEHPLLILTSSSPLSCCFTRTLHVRVCERNRINVKQSVSTILQTSWSHRPEQPACARRLAAPHRRHHPGWADGLPRRNAFWASWVMASASSSITSLKPLLEGGQGFKSTSNGCTGSQQSLRGSRGLGSYLKMVLVLAKLRMGPRTTSMPLSSDALSCKPTSNPIRRAACCRGYNNAQRDWTLDPEPWAYLQHHGVELLLLVQLLGTGQDGGGLAGPGRPVEQQVGKLLLADELLDWKKHADRSMMNTRNRLKTTCWWRYSLKNNEDESNIKGDNNK